MLEVMDAYVYEVEWRREPVKGLIVYNPTGYLEKALFVEGSDLNGFKLNVPNEEGVADDHYVWFRYKVDPQEARKAFLATYENKLLIAKTDVNYYSEYVKMLGGEIENEEET